MTAGVSGGQMLNSHNVRLNPPARHGPDVLPSHGISREGNSATMEQVFFNLHCKLAKFFLRRTSPSFRSLVEHAVLLLAGEMSMTVIEIRLQSLMYIPLFLNSKVCSFVTVFVAHKTFVYKPVQQMRAAEAAASKSRNDSTPYSLQQGPPGSIPWGCLRSIPGFDPNVDVTTIVLRYEVETGVGDRGFTVSSRCASNINCTGNSPFRQRCEASNYTEKALSENQHETCENVAATSKSADINTCTSDLLFRPSDRFLFSYSQTKGYLLLPPSIRERHSILTQYAVIPISDAKCFGESYLQTLMVNVIGPDTIVLNWLLALHNGDGYMYREPARPVIEAERMQMDHLITRAEDAIIDLRFASDYLLMHSLSKSATPSASTFRKLDRFIVFKLGVLLINIFLFCVTTTLVSFTLRETQERMVDFTLLLQSHIRQRLPYLQLVFKHVVESLVFVPITVGTIFFLIEIFEDQFLAIMVLTLVWICEVFSAIR